MENVNEKNRIIVEFDGFKPLSFGNMWRRPNEQTPYSLGELKYHSDWNLLMKIVEKIESMDYGFKMCRKVVEIYVDSTKEMLFKVKESSRIESTYTAVIEFINWYNQNK